MFRSGRHRTAAKALCNTEPGDIYLHVAPAVRQRAALQGGFTWHMFVCCFLYGPVCDAQVLRRYQELSELHERLTGAFGNAGAVASDARRSVYCLVRSLISDAIACRRGAPPSWWCLPPGMGVGSVRSAPSAVERYPLRPSRHAWREQGGITQGAGSEE